MGKTPSEQIDLAAPLSLRSSFLFPMQNAAARREVLIGAAWLLVPVVGWLLNMGHRIRLVHRMQHGLPPWPAWNDYPELLKLGGVTFLGMAVYYTPAAIVAGAAWWAGWAWLWGIAGGLWLMATVAIPGFMSHYCRAYDPREIFNPLVALRRVREGGVAYWHAWAIALAGLAVSWIGLLALGVGFLVTSVWFWQAAGFSFASLFTRRHGLIVPRDEVSRSPRQGRPSLRPPASPASSAGRG